MILIGIALALFFFVEWLLTSATVYKNPVWIPAQGLVHVVYWIMIILAVVGGVMQAKKK